MTNRDMTESSTPFLAILGLAFMILKLCHVITWPWLWVLGPFWIIPGVFVLYMLFIVALVLINSARGRSK